MSEIIFRHLGLEYLDQIYYLLNTSYCDSEVARITFSKKYLYWYLRDLPKENIIGAVYNNKLIGLVTIKPIEYLIDDQKVLLPFIGLRCVHHQISSENFRKSLIFKALESKSVKKNSDYGYLEKVETDEGECVIPINQNKLLKLEFLTEIDEDVSHYSHHLLRLLKEEDLPLVSRGLTNAYANYQSKPLFTDDSCRELFLPKKHVVYSFVSEDCENFISVYKNFIWCLDKKQTITNATLSFCYHQSVDITILLIETIAILKNMGFDQITIRDPRIYQGIEIVKYINYVNFQTIIPGHQDVVPLPFN